MTTLRADTAPKPLLVLVPGLLCSRDLWRDQIERFSNDFEIIVPILSTQTTMDQMALAIVQAVDSVPGHAGGPFHLAGLSMGGYASLTLMSSQTFSPRVLSLAILDSSARADDEDQIARRKALIEMARIGKFKGVTDRLLPLLIAPTRLTDGSLTERVKQMAEDIGRESYFNQQQAILSRRDQRDNLPKITCPLIMICGDVDALTPPERAEEIAAGAPNSRLEIIADCGHLATMERPTAVNGALCAFYKDHGFI